MKGLIKNNLYTTRSNARVFAGIMLVLGLFVIAMDNTIPSLIIGYMLLGMVGFSFNAIAGLPKENAGRWSRYKLTAPVRRADIVRSHFLTLLLWLAVGILFAGTGAALSIMLHGFPFDKSTDIFMLFVTGSSISLFMAAVFFPLFFAGGEERSEAFLIISLLAGIFLLMGLTALVNILFPSPMTTKQILLSGLLILICALLAFALSLPLTSSIFSRKEY